MDGAFFGFESYHILLAGCGACIILAYWLPRFFSGREPAASGLLIVAGLLGFGFIPGMPDAFNPIERPAFWEITSEIAVIIALFGTGLRIDRIRAPKLWQPTFRLIAITMPLTLVAVTLLGWTAGGMTIAGAIILAAVLLPTDPVLAGDIQCGPPLEGGEHPIRFALTTEAGLNDGLALPFVILGLLIASQGLSPGAWGLEWLFVDLIYRVALGAGAGALFGWLLGKIIFHAPRGNALAATGSGVVALAGVLFTYGATELIEGYGLIAAFCMGLALRRSEAEHEFHKKLHNFSESIEHAVTAILLVLMGGTLPLLFQYLDWRHALIAAALIFVIRPLAGWFALLGTALKAPERAVIAVYGVRGIGSIFHLGYAGSHFELANEAQLWATVALSILLSTMLHGVTAGAVVDFASRRAGGSTRR